jgi:hypothetical protein
MLIDCDTCTVRGKACDGCVVNLLFGTAAPAGSGSPAATAAAPTGGDAAERRAIAVLAAAGFEVTVLAEEDTRTRLRLVSSRRKGFHAA